MVERRVGEGGEPGLLGQLVGTEPRRGLRVRLQRRRRREHLAELLGSHAAPRAVPRTPAGLITRLVTVRRRLNL